MLSPPLSPYLELIPAPSRKPSPLGAHAGAERAASAAGKFNAAVSPDEGTDSAQLTPPSSSESPEPFDRSDARSEAANATTAALATGAQLPQSEAPSEPLRQMVGCWDSLLADPVRYFRRERKFLDLYFAHRPNWSNYTYVEVAADTTRVRRRARAHRQRRTHTNHTEVDMSTDSGIMTRSRSAGVQLDRRGDMTSESSAAEDERRAAPSTHVGPPLKKRATTSNAVRVHDLNISQIEDYSPSVDLLPPGRSLRAEWKGAPMDLSQDPDVHLLHPAEVHLASVLRLPAEVYLDSKRRLFAEKVHRLRQGLLFRRTDSQKACRIDVNKASRLFGAFEKVGWLNDEHFTQYL